MEKVYTADTGKLENLPTLKAADLHSKPAQATIEKLEPGRFECENAPSAKAKLNFPAEAVYYLIPLCLSATFSLSAENLPANPPTRPPLKNALNLFVQAEALLWQAEEENLTYVYKTNSTRSFNTLKTLDFHWDFGFRVALGYNAPTNGWDLSVLWTHIRNHAEGKQKEHPLGAVWQVNTVSLSGDLNKAKARWNVHLDQVDIGLGKEYSVGKSLNLRPNIGVRAAWIYQDYDIHYFPSAAASQKIDLSNNYWGVGFCGGVDADWILTKGFSLYSAADFALLFGSFDVDQKAHTIDPTIAYPPQGDFGQKFSCGRGILDISLGLKWAHLFAKKSWGLTFKAGYEYHIYFDQNQFSQVANPTPQFFQPGGDLTYQGVILSGQIDF